MTGHKRSIASYRDAYRAGQRPSEVIAECYDRIEAVGDPGIFLHLANRDLAIGQAEALGAYDPVRKPLWGVPFAVKDNIDVAGMPTTAACPAYGYLPEEDATVVRLLRDAGAIPIGKTNLDQFATGLVGTRTPHPVPKNARDPELVPGGSSSGSAVAVAQGIVPFALGTDTAGSGRIPAGLNGLVGLKPSLGALSTHGVVPACRTLDCVSVFATEVADAMTVFDQACALDPRDPYSRPWRDDGRRLSDGPLRIGVPRTADRRFFGDSAAETAYDAALATLADGTGEIVEVPFGPFYAIAELLYDGPWVAERYAAIEAFLADHEDALHPVTRNIIAPARNYSAVDAFKGLYALEALKREVAPLLESVDLLCVPTAPTWYTVAENRADPIGTNSNLGSYTNFVNLLGLCGLVLPTGEQPDGRPASVTLLAREGRERGLAAFARAVESEGDVPPSNGSAAAKPFEIAVVGAHLSGLPLNHEVTGRGGRLLRTVRTAPDYRLFALNGVTPPKPGLLRVEAGAGHAIEAEIWSLAPAAFGDFVASIPPPLCLGTLRFEDGSAAQGFLAESEGVRDARDVSEYGGWRGFIDAQAGDSV